MPLSQASVKTMTVQFQLVQHQFQKIIATEMQLNIIY